jgi:Zn-dependent peptidase ImmA (M78 family)
MIAIFPELAHLVSSHQIEKLSVEVRRYFAAENATKPMVNLDSLLSSVGIACGLLDLEDLGMIAASDIEGVIMVKMAISSQPISTEERRFLQAHLLGHFFLHLQPDLLRSEWEYRGIRETQQPAERFAVGGGHRSGPEGAEDPTRECEADYFASCLLMPKGMVLRASQSISEKQKVASIFGVSVGVLEARLSMLHAQEMDHKPKSFLDAEGAMQDQKEVSVPKLANNSENQASVSDRAQQNHGQPTKQEIAGAQLQAAIADRLPFGVKAKPPRSLAASNYGTTEKRTDKPVAETRGFKEDSRKMPEVGRSAQRNSDPLKRIRALAKRLDPSVDE